MENRYEARSSPNYSSKKGDDSREIRLIFRAKIGRAATEETASGEVVGSSPRHERLASVSFGRNTDRLSKRHEATAKTNLKCLLTKQSELAALPAHEERDCGFSRRLLLSIWPLSRTPPFAIVRPLKRTWQRCAHPPLLSFHLPPTSCLPSLLISLTKIESGKQEFVK